jgi:peptidoglycan-associated lipoprotein
MPHFKIACYSLVVLLAFAFGGCAPSTAAKPEMAPQKSATTTTPGGSSQGKGEGQRGTGSESSTAPGSLEALQKGQSSATPGSSPLKDVFFEFDRYDLRTDARETLKVNADWLKRNPAARIEIEGHCDSRGTNEYNLALGAKRAQAAKDYLATLGIPADRLSTISYGAEIPVCKEQSEDCWSQNRRARFVVIAGKPAS